ncbi:hypothetical protein [Massilia sp. TSP1-1-2]|uniref:hypothetical protein n=1 Tax=Massilia sp. TSP1-1-2 TaxID=2804649 RepID=UPI003CF7E2F5
MSSPWRLRWLTRGWRHSNCILFAMAIWVRRAANGKRNNYLLLRRSRVHWGVFHMLHGRIGTRSGKFYLVSYKPEIAEKRNFAPIFKGRVERGDAGPAPQPVHRCA